MKDFSSLIGSIYTFSSQPGVLIWCGYASLAGQAEHIPWLKLVYKWLGYHRHTGEGGK